MRDFIAEYVVPLAGTWIETDVISGNTTAVTVVPLAGTWIETRKERVLNHICQTSFPSRERGLKLDRLAERNRGLHRRSPRGNVD